MSSKLKPHEMRNLAPAKETPAMRKSLNKKESQARAIQARREAEAPVKKKEKGHTAVWFMCAVAALFLAFGHGYELGLERNNNPSPPMKAKCKKLIVKG